MSFTIRRNDERYGPPFLRGVWPERIIIEGVTSEEARLIAEKLSDHFAGCQFYYYVVEDEHS